MFSPLNVPVPYTLSLEEIDAFNLFCQRLSNFKMTQNERYFYKNFPGFSYVNTFAHESLIRRLDALFDSIDNTILGKIQSLPNNDQIRIRFKEALMAFTSHFGEIDLDNAFRKSGNIAIYSNALKTGRLKPMLFMQSFTNMNRSKAEEDFAIFFKSQKFLNVHAFEKYCIPRGYKDFFLPLFPIHSNQEALFQSVGREVPMDLSTENAMRFHRKRL